MLIPEFTECSWSHPMAEKEGVKTERHAPHVMDDIKAIRDRWLQVGNPWMVVAPTPPAAPVSTATVCGHCRTTFNTKKGTTERECTNDCKTKV